MVQDNARADRALSGTLTGAGMTFPSGEAGDVNHRSAGIRPTSEFPMLAGIRPEGERAEYRPAR